MGYPLTLGSEVQSPLSTPIYQRLLRTQNQERRSTKIDENPGFSYSVAVTVAVISLMKWPAKPDEQKCRNLMYSSLAILSALLASATPETYFLEKRRISRFFGDVAINGCCQK
jgi:hypothetical protein